MKRTIISQTGFWTGMVLFALAGCTKEPVESLDGPQDAVLSVAEANWEGSSTAARSVAEDGAAQTRAIVDGAGHTFFTDRDLLGLFLRGDGYEDVDNRMVRLNYPGEGSEKEWQITGTGISLSNRDATVTAYFPYYPLNTMSAVQLKPGPYKVNTNDLVWQRDVVNSTHAKAMFLDMKHAMTRVKIRLSGGSSTRVGDEAQGGVVCWTSPEDPNDFRVVALDEVSSVWAPNSYYILGSAAQDLSARNGADIWPLAKSYSADNTSAASNATTGVFATDFPAFSYCYEKTDGGVPKGTWYLPSARELQDLYAAKEAIVPVITAAGGTAINAKAYISSTERADSPIAGRVYYYMRSEDGSLSSVLKTSTFGVARCMRKPLVQEKNENSDIYLGEGKIAGVGISDAEDVAEADCSIYSFGFLDLTEISPTYTYGYPGSVTEMAEKDLTRDGALYDLLLLPVEKIDEGQVMLSVYIDGKILSAPFPTDVVGMWGPGRAYTYDVKILNGEARMVFGKAAATPWNEGGSIGGGLDKWIPEIGAPEGGGVIYWVNPDDKDDYRIIALDERISSWAASGSYRLSAYSQIDRNGAEVMQLAKEYSDNRMNGATGVFSTDFPAFSYCYEKTDGGVPKGTWYVPSYQELVDLNAVKDAVSSAISKWGGTTFGSAGYWTATEYTSSTMAWAVNPRSLANSNFFNKNESLRVRCVRKK